MWRTLHRCCCSAGETAGRSPLGAALGARTGEPMRAAAGTRAWQRKLEHGRQQQYGVLAAGPS